MLKKRLMSGCIVLAFGLILAGAIVSAQEPSLRVVATTSIIADVVANVGGDQVEVTSLIPPDADVHSFQPAPRDVAGVVQADIVFVNGGFLEEGLLDIVRTNANGEIFAVSAGVEMLAFEGHSHAHDDDDEHGHADEDGHDDEHGHEGEERHDDEHGHDEADESAAHAQENGEHVGVLSNSLDCELVHEEGDHGEDDHADEEHDEEHEDGHDEDGHNHGPCDPHVWADPANVMIWAENIALILGRFDPDHAEVYEANAAAYITELQALDAEIAAMITTIPEENRVLVTNHEFLAYFAVRYDFEIVGTVIPAATTVAEVPPQAIVELVEIIKAEEVRAIFAEISDTTALAETVAAEGDTDVQVLTLYSGSLSSPAGPAGTYLDYMRYNTQVIVDGLSG